MPWFFDFYFISKKNSILTDNRSLSRFLGGLRIFEVSVECTKEHGHSRKTSSDLWSSEWRTKYRKKHWDTVRIYRGIILIREQSHIWAGNRIRDFLIRSQRCYLRAMQPDNYNYCYLNWWLYIVTLYHR